MRGWKSNPWFVLTLAGLGFLAAAEVVYAYGRRRLALQAELRWRKKQAEWQDLCRTVPAVTPENATAIAADFTRVDERKRTLQATLRGRGPWADRWHRGTRPAKSTDAFFDLATMAERLRERAWQEGVKCKPDECFGFSAYRHQGPEPASISAIFRQRVALQFLAEALIAARPEQLIALQREPPGAAGAHASAASPRAASSSLPKTDLFALDPRLSVRVPGQVATMAFRVSFIGQTASLRAFLRMLAEGDFPLLVRALEVEPAVAGGTIVAEDHRVFSSRPATSHRSSEENGDRIPIVLRALSKFVVTVECFEWIASAPEPDAPSAETGT